jgi:hypothetical protein
MTDKNTNESARLRPRVNFTKRDGRVQYREGALQHRDFSATNL